MAQKAHDCAYHAHDDIPQVNGVFALFALMDRILDHNGHNHQEERAALEPPVVPFIIVVAVPDAKDLHSEEAQDGHYCAHDFANVHLRL